MDGKRLQRRLAYLSRAGGKKQKRSRLRLKKAAALEKALDLEVGPPWEWAWALRKLLKRRRVFGSLCTSAPGVHD